MGFTKRIKIYFFRGLAVLLPTILTMWIFVWGFHFIQSTISIHINKGLVQLIMWIQHRVSETPAWPEDVLTEFLVHGAGALAGFAVALAAILIVGALLASVVGKTLWHTFEKFIMSTPFVKRVYPYIKQVTDFLFSQEEEKKKLFSRVVAVEYPRKGIWSVGMVTGPGLEKVVEHVGKECVTILIPTSPTPFTGFVITVPKEQTIELDITIEEAFRFTVSAGVIIPNKVLTGHEVVALPGRDRENKA